MKKTTRFKPHNSAIQFNSNLLLRKSIATLALCLFMLCAFAQTQKSEQRQLLKTEKDGEYVIKVYSYADNTYSYEISKNNALLTSDRIKPQKGSELGYMSPAELPDGVLKLGKSIVTNIRQYGFENAVLPSKRAH